MSKELFALDTMKLRDMMTVPGLPNPMEVMMKQTVDGLHKKEMAMIKDILRHHIDCPIEGELTREKVKAAGIRGVMYSDNFPQSRIEHDGNGICISVTSGLMGVVQGDWLIGQGGARRPLTDKERHYFERLERKEQLTGRMVVIKEHGDEERVCYCHGVENDNGTAYWQFADSNGSTWQIPTDEVHPRLANDDEVVAYYLAQCREVAKCNYE
jgi:hypothetical protein